ncbi:MAG: hypothetical protein GXN98_00230 [Euryarchaeota archaeon]|nr:hypothetical protein [Euryarchaeota archaeon]
MTLVTTSRKPSPRTRTFSRDLARAIGGRYLTRGKANLEHVFSLDERVVIVKERRGNPSLIEVYVNGERRFALKLRRAMLCRELKHSYGYGEGELAARAQRWLGGMVRQRGNSLLFGMAGPEVGVEKVIEEEAQDAEGLRKAEA